MLKTKSKPITEPAPQPPPVRPAPPSSSPLDCGPMRLTGSPKLTSFINGANPMKPIITAVPGLDLSFYQPKVNWEEVAREGIQFVIAKASDGMGTKDSMFDTHRKNAAAKGIIFGGYHFLRFGGMNPKEEAAHFMKCSGGVRAGELPLTLDVEWDRKNPKYASGKTMDDAAANEALEMLERIEDAIGMTPIIYCSWPFFKNFRNPERFFRFIPWNPAYWRDGSNGHKVNKISGPSVPLPWSRSAFWQWTDEHPAAKRIVGATKLDANWFAGSLEQLRGLTK